MRITLLVILGAIAITIGIAFLLGSSYPASPADLSGTSPEVISGTGQTTTSPPNAFLPNRQQSYKGLSLGTQNTSIASPAPALPTKNQHASNNTPAPSVSSNNQQGGNTPPSQPLFPPIPTPQQIASVTGSSSGSVTASSSQSVTPLPIPDVPVSELTVDSSGVSTIRNYLQYFTDHPNGAMFDYSQLFSVLKSKDGIPLLPAELVGQALVNGHFKKVHDSLVIEQNFLSAKIAFEKGITVSGDGIAFNQEMIGFDELTQTLIQNALNVESGTMSSDDLKSYLASYVETVQEAHNTIVIGLAIESGKLSLWDVALVRLDLMSVAEANNSLQVPFGGQIVKTDECDPLGIGCQINVPSSVTVAGEDFACIELYGVLFYIGLPGTAIGSVDNTPPLPVYAPYTFLLTTILYTPYYQFYAYYDFIPGTWWLGLYQTPIPIPCLGVVYLPGCDKCPIDFTIKGWGFPVVIVGTSYGPSAPTVIQ